MIKPILAALLLVFSLAGSAYAQINPIKGLGIKLGDSIGEVKTALHTNLDPEPIENSIASPYFPNKARSLLHLRTKGIQVYFNRKDAVESIKIEQPFPGSVAGVKIGSTEKAVVSVMGKPIKKPWNFGANKCLLYALDDTAYIRFDINENDGVQIIYIQK